MATIIVNPTSASNGAGSLIDPKNTYTGLSLSPGDTVLQVAGTTFVGTDATNAVNIATGGSSDDARITLGVCHAQTGIRIMGGSQRAKIDANRATRGINMGNLIGYVTIDGLEVFNAALRGIQKSTSANSPSAAGYVRVVNSYVHDIGDGATESYAIAMYGKGNVADGNLILNCGRVGIFGTADNFSVTNNHIDRIGLEQLGDCIQLTGSARPRILGNYLRKTNDQKAICIVGTGSSGGVFAFNQCFGPTWTSGGSYPLKGLNTEAAGMLVAGNLFDCGAEYVVFGNAAGLRVGGNVIVSRSTSAVAALALVGSDSLVTCNTVIGAARGARGISVSSNAYTGIGLRNNIVVGFAKGMRIGTGATESHNCFFDNTQDLTNASDAVQSISANSIASDPLLDASYRLTALSPCRGAGVYIPGAKHFGGVPMNPGSPDIGAHRFFEARELATERDVRRVW